MNRRLMGRKIRAPYWTPARIQEALQRFAREYGEIVTSSERYVELTKDVPRTTTGRHAYPSANTILRHFSSFRAAWKSCGIKTPRCVPNASEAWTPEEDWFLSEACGIYSRKEIAEYLERTENAVHRRLYDLGIDTREARGWSVFRLSRVTGVSEVVIRTYQDRGELPFFRGTRSLYHDPADFLCIRQIDWRHPPPELERAVRQSLMQRLACVLMGKDWRMGRIYQPHRTRTTNRKIGDQWVVPPPPMPKAIQIGDQVTCNSTSGRNLTGRVGIVKHIYWTPNRKYGERADVGACWMVRVEFRKLKRHGKQDPRVTYSLPIDTVHTVTRRAG